MPDTPHRLTLSFVRRVREPGRYYDQDGLILTVSKGGGKSWIQRLTIQGRRQDIGLGSAHLITPAQARRQALKNREIARAGGNPLAPQPDGRRSPRPGGIEEKYAKVPLKVFDDIRIRQNVLKWRDTFSDGTGDNLFSTLQRILSFGLDQGILQHHHLLKVRKKVKKNRAEIIWTPDEVDLFISKAPGYVGRILRVALETGLRPGDMQILKRSHIETTSNGNHRLLMRTRKSSGRNFASIPVTEGLAALIREIPEDQEHLIVASDGEPFRTSEALGSTVSHWRDQLGIRKQLRLYDARGTAVTRLVRAGCTLSELAAHMGWSLAHAAAMLERYAALDPDMSDGIL
jgi:integrase